MRDVVRMFVVVAQASLIVTLGYFALSLTLGQRFLTHGASLDAMALVVILVLLAPIGVAALWLFRRLRVIYMRDEARSVAIGFALFTPASLTIAILLSQLTGGFAASLLGTPFGVVGAVVGLALMITVASFLLAMFVLWITRATNRTDEPQR